MLTTPGTADAAICAGDFANAAGAPSASAATTATSRADPPKGDRQASGPGRALKTRGTWESTIPVIGTGVPPVVRRTAMPGAGLEPACR